MGEARAGLLIVLAGVVHDKVMMIERRGVAEAGVRALAAAMVREAEEEAAGGSI